MCSPTEGVTEIGKNDAQRLVRLGLHADRLSSQRNLLNNSTSKRKKRKAKRLDGAIARISRKIKNLRNELHKKTVNHLVQNYDVVIIPEFDVKNMVTKNQFESGSEHAHLVTLCIPAAAETQGRGNRRDGNHPG